MLVLARLFASAFLSLSVMPPSPRFCATTPQLSAAWPSSSSTSPTTSSSLAATRKCFTSRLQRHTPPSIPDPGSSLPSRLYLVLWLYSSRRLPLHGRYLFEMVFRHGVGQSGAIPDAAVLMARISLPVAYLWGGKLPRSSWLGVSVSFLHGTGAIAWIQK
jgi:hypothetical protein